MKDIEIKEKFTIKELKTIEPEILECVKENQDMSIKLTDINAIDISSIQFLITLQADQKSKGKNLVIDMTCDDNTESLLKNSGLLNILKN